MSIKNVKRLIVQQLLQFKARKEETAKLNFLLIHIIEKIVVLFIRSSFCFLSHPAFLSQPSPTEGLCRLKQICNHWAL
jgi:hypothetical protein